MAERIDQMVDERKGALSFRNIHKEFIDNDGNKFVALDNFSMDIQPGSFVSLIGPSGCGKSTLLRMIAGLDTPTNGEILLDDEKVDGTNHERGLVFQQANLFPWLNVRENVATGLVARKVYKENKDEVDKYIKLVGLSGFEKSYPHQLSGGMAQRVSLVRVLVNKPKVLLLDEPLGALDAFTRMNMQDEILKIWREQKVTVILVTHDVDEAVYMSDTIVILSSRPGRIQEVIKLRQNRTRSRNYPDFVDLRTRILEKLNFASTEDTAGYYI